MLGLSCSAPPLHPKVKWEYQGKDGRVYGTFTSDQISGWIENGFFTGDGAVLIRRAASSSSSYTGNGNGEAREGAERRVTWQSTVDEEVFEEEGGYEECKGDGEAKRRRQLVDDGNGETSASKRSRVEAAVTASVSASEDLMNDLEDLEDSDKEEELKVAGEKKNLHQVTAAESSETHTDSEVSGSSSFREESSELGAGIGDIYADWQSSDDIDWSLIVRAPE